MTIKRIINTLAVLVLVLSGVAVLFMVLFMFYLLFGWFGVGIVLVVMLGTGSVFSA